jgi:transcriptional regulator with XRE-family HTH domain
MQELNDRPPELIGFSRRLKEERARTGHSQIGFADLGGVKKTSQVQYEAGNSPPTVAYLYRLAEHGIDIGYILTGKRSDQPEDEASARFLRRFAMLGGRERRAISHLVEDLLGPAQEGFDLAAMIGGRDIASAMVQSPAQPFKGKDEKG